MLNFMGRFLAIAARRHHQSVTQRRIAQTHHADVVFQECRYVEGLSLVAVKLLLVRQTSSAID